MKLYKSYVFKDKDPAIDKLRTLVQDTYGELNGRALRQIEQSGGPSFGCMNAWFFGDTKRPTNPTIEAAGRAMGFERRWVRMKKRNGK